MHRGALAEARGVPSRRRHPVHLAAKVAVRVAHARRNFAAGQDVEVRFSFGSIRLSSSWQRSQRPF